MRRDNGQPALTLTLREAQALATIASGLDRRPFTRRVRKDDIMAVFERLGCIQLDTISVISRSHETVLWSRLGAYDTSLLPELYAPDNRLTETIAHAAAIIPTELLPLFRWRNQVAREKHAEWFADPDRARHIERVIDRIRREGALSSHDFEVNDDAAAGSAWDWYGRKPEREVLAGLWNAGELAIHLRSQAFTRFFDLPSRVYPGIEELPIPSREEVAREYVLRAVRALGVTTGKWASDYWRPQGPGYVPMKTIREHLNSLVDDDLAVRIQVDGIDEPLWMDTSLLPRLDSLRARKGWPTLTTFLSPFDNLIWNRDRMERLWGLPYRIEIYVKEYNRKYGYYSMPILHRGRLIGLIDPSFDRTRRHLTIRNLHILGVTPTAAIANAIRGAIEDLVAFLGGERGAWSLMNVQPADVADQLSGKSSGINELPGSDVPVSSSKSGDSRNDVNT